MKRAFITAGLTMLGALQLEAQSGADAAVQQCRTAADAGNEKLAKSEADRADSLFDQMIAARTNLTAAFTGKAQVISFCRVPSAPMMSKMALIDEGNEFLKRALAVDSTHFGARYMLAMNHFHVPEMFGRTDAALTELEKLVGMARGRPIPQLANIFLFLGDVYTRKGRKADAAATWREGKTAFPERTAEFDQRLTKAGANETQAAAPAPAAASANPPMAAYDVAPIVVEAGRFTVDDTRGGASLKRMDIVTMPGGTADVLQVFQAMPGVTRATEGSDLYVRGGDPAEAPVFVDGARMTYAGAFEGLHGGIFGVLDPNAIKKADFSSGGFSTRYGNALSGVLDITTEGRPNASSWRAGVNLVSAGATARAPLGDKLGYYVSGRATETSALLWSQNRLNEYQNNPWSINGMAGLTFNPTPLLEVKATALTEADQATPVVDVLGYRGALRATGGTHMGVLSARALNKAATASLRGSVSAALRSTSFQVGVLDRERADYSYTMRLDGDVATSSAVRLRAGIEGAAFDTRERGLMPTSANLAPGAPSERVNAEYEANHAGAYAEGEVQASSKLAFIAGLRSDHLPAADAWTLDPRLSVAYRTNGWTLRTGAGLFHQGAWRTGYRTPNPGAPSGVATRARHLVFAIEREATTLLRIEAYAKSYDGYEQIAGSAAVDGSGPLLDRGRVLGVDALYRWKASGAVTGWASYSFLNARVRLADSGDWIASSTDVHHTMTSVIKYAFGDWEVGTTTRLGSGRPFTPIRGSRLDGSQRVAVYGDIHSERMPAYARFDTRLTRLFPTAKGTYVLYLEALNLLDRHNVMAYTYDSSYTRRVPVESFFANRTLVFGAEAMF